MAGAPSFGERAAYGPNDVCYRHPSVHSFALCQRCGRTICGECQVVSAVGVLCPDCVRQMQPSGSTRAKRSTKVLGRRIAALDTPVTYAIMALCVVVYLAQLATHYFGNDEVTRALWYAPLYSVPPSMLPAGLDFEPWRMVTSMFTHSTGFVFHILFNMYALWLFGRNLEGMLGKWRFAALYLLSGLGGSLVVMLWSYADPNALMTPTVGASGAIFGVLGATLVAARAARVNVTSLLVLVAINFGIGLIPGANVSWQAHLGGLIVGAGTMWALLQLRRSSPAKRTLALSGIAGVLVLASFAFFFALPV
ncbi:membrane associated rhomboid family serine protease [Leucobacter exalbidus]|uniref:Membrane associated rhomboid family serine protease n=1 Tax=Leucobacter exalbidus TaxID=662960 RepID=A0A940PNT2_9MICO|nr:rhomboid family intramembrane serine protease [Leucobacter exalbidus]MBP1326573.1 membrane associated rhomboid family serine protease [Leucobacter exalbidus]